MSIDSMHLESRFISQVEKRQVSIENISLLFVSEIPVLYGRVDYPLIR